jgi:hypothetical protein
MVLAIQMILPAIVVDNLASFKGDSSATGTALPATRMTLPLTMTALPPARTTLLTTETVLESFEWIPCV